MSASEAIFCLSIGTLGFGAFCLLIRGYGRYHRRRCAEERAARERAAERQARRSERQAKERRTREAVDRRLTLRDELEALYQLPAFQERAR